MLQGERELYRIKMKAAVQTGKKSNTLKDDSTVAFL